jgi:hypothetical protein
VVPGTLISNPKVRTGPPKDNEEDYDGPVWAGVIPLALTAGKPERIRHSSQASTAGLVARGICSARFRSKRPIAAQPGTR